MALGGLKTLEVHLVELYVDTTLLTMESKHDLLSDSSRLSHSALFINLSSATLKEKMILDEF